MQHSKLTLGIAEKYRAARNAYLGLDIKATPADRVREVHLSYLIAAEDLASAVLADIDQPEANR